MLFTVEPGIEYTNRRKNMDMKKMAISLMIVHLWLCQMMYRIDFNGFRNHMKDESGRLEIEKCDINVCFQRNESSLQT